MAMEKPITGEPLDVSIIVCTRNRAQSLRRMLESASKLQIPDGVLWELVVVDNGSSDATRDVVIGFVDRLPVCHVHEAEAGLSNARNRGVAEARGALILWTDDDVMVDPGWLAAYVEAAQRYPEAAFFGGRILPVLEEPRSELFVRNFDHPVLGNLMARRKFDGPTASITPDNMPFGANFAIRSIWQHRFAYRKELGVSPLQSRSGEESNLLHEIMGLGATGLTVPGACVQHFIPSSRQSRKYVAKYYYSIGETHALIKNHVGFALPVGTAATGRWLIFGVPSWKYRLAFGRWLRMLAWRLIGNDSKWLINCREFYLNYAEIMFTMKFVKR
jgi:glucosyl-dolichyl phosphate glucuronosyltransferase